MANAKVTPEVTETKVVVVEPAKVTLNLSREEAQMLRSILGRFEAGGPTSSIFSALTDVTGYDGRYNLRQKTDYKTLGSVNTLVLEVPDN